MEGQTSDEVIEISGAKVPCQKVTWQPKILQSGAPQLAPNRCWIDSQGRIVRRQLELDGLGLITLELSNQEAIREASKATPTRDLGDSSLISLDRPVPNARQARGVVYRLRWKEASGNKWSWRTTITNNCDLPLMEPWKSSPAAARNPNGLLAHQMPPRVLEHQPIYRYRPSPNSRNGATRWRLRR